MGKNALIVCAALRHLAGSREAPEPQGWWRDWGMYVIPLALVLAFVALGVAVLVGNGRNAALVPVVLVTSVVAAVLLTSEVAELLLQIE